MSLQESSFSHTRKLAAPRLGARPRGHSPLPGTNELVRHQCPFEGPWDAGDGQIAGPSQETQRSAGNRPPSLRAEPWLASATPSGAQRLQPGPSTFVQLPDPPWTQREARTRKPSLAFRKDAQGSPPAVCRCPGGSNLAPFPTQSEGEI